MGSSFKKTCIYVEELYPQKSLVRTSSKHNEESFEKYISRNIKFNRIKEIIQGKRNFFQTQCEAFQVAMIVPLIVGQYIGLIPVIGILEKDVSKVRFKIRSLRFLYNCTMCIIQIGATIVCLFKMFEEPVTVRRLGNFLFYLTTCITSIVFLQLATKWQYILKEVIAAKLDEYIDPSIKFKCYCATITLLGSALIEHILVLIARTSIVTDCWETEGSVYKEVVEKMIYWNFGVNVTYYFPIGIILLVVNFISTLNWSYSNIFIICISLFLASILEQINKKIKATEGEFFSPSQWRKLREDYNRATTLIRTFDDVISSIIFFSFASNLFFVCLQLFNTLTNVVTTFASVKGCPHYPSGLFHGYELLTYYLYSLIFIISRFLAVALIASRVHTASRVAAPCLYSLPSASYCTEVQRFIQQVQGNFIALSGLNYFYVTKELILSVAGTVVTYELVLLQMDN